MSDIIEMLAAAQRGRSLQDQQLQRYHANQADYAAMQNTTESQRAAQYGDSLLNAMPSYRYARAAQRQRALDARVDSGDYSGITLIDNYMADRAGLNTAAATGVPSARVCSWCKGPRTAAVCAGCGGVTP